MTPPPAAPRRILRIADYLGLACQYSLELSAGLAVHGVQVALAVADKPTAAQRAEAEAISELRLQLLEVRLDGPASAAASWRSPPQGKVT